MQNSISQHGNGNAISVSKAILDAMGLKRGDNINMQLHGRNLIITPITNFASDEKVNKAFKRVVSKRGKLLKSLAKK